jgi:polysaccharide biosynthesis protein PelC
MGLLTGINSIELMNKRSFLICTSTLAVSACTTVDVPKAPSFEANALWALLPIINLTETPQAGLRTEAIVLSLLRSGKLPKIVRYPSSIASENTFEPLDRKAVDQAFTWAKAEKIRYCVTGNVDEWRYKVGVDGEPAVGFTFEVTDLETKTVVWSAAGSRTGWSREALSAVAQKLIAELTQPLGVASRSTWKVF